MRHVNMDAMMLAAEWMRRDAQERRQDAREHKYCAACDASQPVRQKIVDETCCYVCDVCERVVDGDSPF